MGKAYELFIYTDTTTEKQASMSICYPLITVHKPILFNTHVILR